MTSRTREGTYNADTDVFYLRLGVGRFDRNERLDGQRILDLDVDGNPLGVEVIFASHGTDLEGLPEPERVREALEGLGLPVKTPA